MLRWLRCKLGWHTWLFYGTHAYALCCDKEL